jgi:hypothetical protein
MRELAKKLCRWALGTVPGTKKKQEAEIAASKRKIKVNTDKVNKTVRANMIAKQF